MLSRRLEILVAFSGEVKDDGVEYTDEEFFIKMFKDEEFMYEVIKLLLPEVYRKL